MAVGDPKHSRGTHAKSKQTEAAVPKDDKIGKRWVIFTHQAPSCQDVKAQQWQRSPLLKHTHMQMLRTGKHTQQANTSGEAVVQ